MYVSLYVPVAMRPNHAGQLMVIVVALLALTAGCQSLGDSGPATETNATNTDTPETRPTGTNTTETEQNDTTDTLTESFAESHLRTLRQAGNASVSRAVRTPETDGYGYPPVSSWSRSAAGSFDDGRFYSQSRYPSLGASWATYQAANGTVFTISGGSGYTTRTANGSVDRTAPFELTAVNVTKLEHSGQGTVAGVNGTVYETSSVEAMGEAAFPGVDTANVTAFTATYVVDDRGYAAYQRLNATVDRGNQTTRAVKTVRISGVGSTTVEPPGWVDEAEAETDGEPNAPTDSQ